MPYAKTLPARVAATTTRLPSWSPHVPSSGLATTQSLVSFGHASLCRPSAPNALRSRCALAATTSSPGAPPTSPIDGPGEEREVVLPCREAEAQLAAAGVPGADRVLAALVLVDRQVERAQQARRRRDERRAAADVAERGMPDRRQRQQVGAQRVAGRDVGLHAHRLAVDAPEARAAVGVEHHRGPAVRDHADLRPAPAAGTVQRRDHRRAGDALADHRQQLREDLADLHRPAVDELPVRRDRVEARVGEVEDAQRLDEVQRKVVQRRDVEPAVLARLVLLVGADDDLGTPVAGEVADCRRVDDRALVELGADAVLERDAVRAPVDGLDLRRVDDEHREAAHELAVRTPGVDVAVHARGDDLEALVTVEVGEHGRADEAVLRAVAMAAPLGDEAPQRTAGVRAPRLDAQLAPPARIPRIDLALEVRGDDLRRAVAIEVAGGKRGEDRAARATAAQAVGACRPARQLAAIATDRVDETVGAGDQQLRAVVAVEVDEQRRRLDVAAVEAPWEPWQQVLVAMQVEVAAVARRARPRPPPRPSR